MLRITSALALLALVVLPAPASSHPLAFTQSELILRVDGTFQVEMVCDLDALALGVSQDADDAELVAMLHELTPEQLDQRVERLRELFRRRVRIRFDGQPVTFDVAFPDYGTARADEAEIPTVLGLTARLRGTVPTNATEVEFFASRSFSDVHLAIVDESRQVSRRSVLERGARSDPFVLTGPVEPTSRGEVARRYLRLGFAHIMPNGLDHILFVVCLFLLSTSLRPLVWQVTAFTLAHALTLTLATFDLVALSPTLVEPLIALSIAYVAIENVLTQRLTPWRPPVVFAFGLLHGFGIRHRPSRAGAARRRATDRTSHLQRRDRARSAHGHRDGHLHRGLVSPPRMVPRAGRRARVSCHCRRWSGLDGRARAAMTGCRFKTPGARDIITVSSGIMSGRCPLQRGIQMITAGPGAPLRVAAAVLVGALAATSVGFASDWPSWRGRAQTGVSNEARLPSSWSKDGENLIWSDDWVGRSTPAVFDGRVCANGRTGEGVSKAEIVAYWNAENGTRLWTHTFSIANTTVPFNRVGWGSVTGDPETGYLFAVNVDGHLNAFARDGTIVWTWRLAEELGRASGYGGRTSTPVVDEDSVILSVIGSLWGDYRGPPRHRYFSFDKRTGKVQWISTPGSNVFDMNTQSVPIIAVVNGRRLLIDGNADGHIYALLARTGEKIWEFSLSKRGINVSPVIDESTVYVAHSEENVDGGPMGRVVAIDATGTGDVTSTHEKWRINELAVGFPSPLIKDGQLFVIDNSANLVAIDAADGVSLWTHSIGTVGKSSPVWADGKLYVTEVNGNVHILEPGSNGVTVSSTARSWR